MKLVPFIRLGESIVYVNPELVSAVIDRGDHTAIIFGHSDENCLFVTESVKEVVVELTGRDPE